jgi:two-component system CheB/CheR fusion protein
MLAADPHHIIAIGASAGGMDEINSFFDHTPLDGVSYVIIQHLSPDFKSRMVELLARHSKLVVKEAQDGATVKSNEVYLIPHDQFMTITGGTLVLTNKGQHPGLHLTIDAFFNSLAENSGSKAIGVILSGLGRDGTEGVKAIKKAGGMVMARNPETSLFGSMPSHAIATGIVDFILEPELMPAAIEEYVKHEQELLADEQEDEKTLTEIIALIKEKSPLDFSDYKLSTILRRTKRRASNNNYTSLASYLDFLKTSPDEVEALGKDFLISVTSFFRDNEAFEFITNDILPDLLGKLAVGEELKMWIAGCATGEEVYSMAILIAEHLHGNFANVAVKLFATDIDSLALAHAAKGIYNHAIKKDVSAERLQKYFIREKAGYRIIPSIRKMVIFAQHDLVKNPPYCNMHLITCRNLLIYMTPVLQKKIYTMLLFGLKINGYLFLGSSESPMPIIKDLEVVNKKWKIYKNLKAKRGVSFDAFSLPELLDIKRTPAKFLPEDTGNANNVLSDHMHTLLAQNIGYLAVCINEANSVIKSYGDTSRFLLQQNFNLNLAELLPKPLAIAFNALKIDALKTKEKVSVSGVKIKYGKKIIKVNLSVIPLIPKKGDQTLLLVTFMQEAKVTAATTDEKIFDEKIYHDKYTTNLEEELKELKFKLNSAYERLDASNENMQSFNEELISANEEMQSTNEEMESVNEELHTINSDYQLKNKELLETNDDLNNYFRSNINGQLFINNDLQLMKFSPGTVKQINLLETDIGRPLSNISTNIKFETIIDDIKKVLHDGSVITKEIETNNGKWYQIMTMPYVQQSDNKRNGAIITFNDITELKDIQQELNISNNMLGMAIDSTEMGTWTIDIKTRKFTPSARLKTMFGFYPTEDMTYEDAIAQVVEKYRHIVTEAVENAITTGAKCDVEYPLHGFRDKKLRWVRGIGNLALDKDGKPTYFTGLLLDITLFKLDELRKNDFIAMASHELKTPLTAIQGYVQLLNLKAKKASDDFAVTYLVKANHQVKKMTTLINGFLNASSFEAGKIYLNEETFEMNTLLDEVVEELLLTTSSHQVSVLPGPVMSIKADRDKIGQVISNFLSNAIKYSPKGGNIKLQCMQADNMLQVSVEDEGIGINPEEQEKLFDRYYRIESAHTTSISGFGLGLYLSAEIIHRHKGKVWSESVLGKGSTFYFSLPLAVPSLN